MCAMAMDSRSSGGNGLLSKLTGALSDGVASLHLPSSERGGFFGAAADREDDVAHGHREPVSFTDSDTFCEHSKADVDRRTKELLSKKLLNADDRASVPDVAHEQGDPQKAELLHAKLSRTLDVIDAKAKDKSDKMETEKVIEEQIALRQLVRKFWDIVSKSVKRADPTAAVAGGDSTEQDSSSPSASRT